MNREYVQRTIAGIIYDAGWTVRTDNILAGLQVDVTTGNIRGMLAYRVIKNDGTECRMSCRVGKFLVKYLGITGDKLIQDIGAAIGAALWVADDAAECGGIVLLSGEDLREFYSSRVSGIRSCMSTDEAQDYLDIYVDNPNVVKLATVRIDGHAGRALVWTLPDGRLYLDRIYTDGSDVCRAALKAFGEAQAQVTYDGAQAQVLCDSSLGGVPLGMKIRNGEDSRWPYMDTFQGMCITDSRHCLLSEDSGDYSLTTTDGYLEGRNLVCTWCGDTVGEDENCQTPSGEDCCESCYDEHYFSCEACGEVHVAAERCDANGSGYCESCFDDRFTVCDDCENTVEQDAVTTVYGGNQVCPRCLSRNYTKCDGCGEYAKDEDLKRGGEDDLCPDCFDKDWGECSECGEVFAREGKSETKCPDCLQLTATCPVCQKVFLKASLVDGVCSDCAMDSALETTAHVD
jgi:hypothetical protein